jgi:multiple sugar transport system permease protein
MPRQPSSTGTQTRKSKLASWSVHGILLAWTAICLFPLYWLVITSIQGPKYLPFVDFQPDLASWRFILADAAENLDLRFFNSLVIGLGSTALIMVAAVLLLYAVTRIPSRSLRWLTGNRLIAFVLASRIIVPSAIAVPLYVFATLSQLLDTRILMVFVYAGINLPVAVWLLRPVFRMGPTEQEEAASLDGASHVMLLVQVLLPMVRAACGVVALIVFILCWNEYLLAATLTFEHAETLTPWMVGQLSMKEAQTGGETEEWAHLSAAAVLMMVPLLLVASMVQRYLTRMAPWQK